MLRTLVEAIRRATHSHVRFLPIIVIILITFFLPVSIKNYLVQPNIAEAGWFSLGEIGESILEGLEIILFGLLHIIALIVFKVTGVIFVMSGWLFENSVVYSLSGTLYSSFKFINVGWVFIRDLINSLFIFIVLFIALKELIKFSGKVDTTKLQKTLLNIIVAALLINFSLFFTKAAIDVSNFLSRAIYYTMENKPSDGSPSSYGPANALVAGLNIQSLLKDGDTNYRTETGIRDSEMLKSIVYIGGSAVHIMAAVMFFTMAFFFLARILILVLLMLTSPLYFLGLILSNVSIVKKYSGMWFDQLTSQLLFPVLFMLIIYIAVTFVNQGLLTQRAGESMTAALSGGASGFATIINFGIVLTIMYMATKTARETAGTYTKQLGEMMAGKAASAGFSATAWAGRNTFGGIGRRMSESEKAKGWASSNNRFKRLAGDSIIGGGKAMYEGNWDLRSSGPISDVYGVANKNTHQLKVGGPTTRNAKANVPEWWTKDKSKDGQAKQAAKITRKFENYNTVEAKISKIQTTIGDKINNKEYKSIKESLITEIRTTYKDDPSKQKDLIEKLIGKPALDSSENSKVRGEINKDINNKQFKDSAKKHGDAQDNYKKAVEDLATENAKAVPDQQRVAELTAKRDAEAATAKSELAKFEESAKKASPALIKDLATKDIAHLQGQLSKAHLAALSSKMAAGEYGLDDEKLLNDMVKDIRSTTKSPETLEWIRNEAMKGTSGFNLKLNEDITEILKDFSTKNAAEQAAERVKIAEIIRVISNKELQALKLEEFTNEEILKLLNPNIVQAQSKRILGGNDQAEIAKLEQVIQNIENGSLLGGESDDKKDQYIAALRGEKIPRLRPTIRPTATAPLQPTPATQGYNVNQTTTSTSAQPSTNTTVQGQQQPTPTTVNYNVTQSGAQNNTNTSTAGPQQPTPATISYTIRN